ncbi:MAG: sodium:proton antiporter [Acidobacteriota bacterium]
MLAWISVLVAVAALFGWVSARVLRLPNTIGTMLLTAVTSMVLVFFDPILPGPHLAVMRMMGQVDFARLFLHGMLGLLLFAGSFLLDLDGLRRQRLPVALLSVLTTVVSVLMVGAGTYAVARVFGFQSSWLECLLFGALISPTDPIAVLEMLRRVKAPKHLESQLAGESLFNDGVGAVIFLALLAAATQGTTPRPMEIVGKIVLTGGGGMLLGAVLAVPAAVLMLSLALALGGYSIADHVGVSGPLASVVSALVLRWLIEKIPGEEVAHVELNHMWTNVDEILNAILFVLLGAEFLMISFHPQTVALGLSEVVVVNVVRVASVAVALGIARCLRCAEPTSLTVLSWGGLRGGLSIALALSIPAGYGGGWIVTSTYVLVAFSILVQGGTMGLLLKRVAAAEALA